MNKEQIEILRHTAHRAANNVFCGDSADMQALVELGYMRDMGQPGWSLDRYFTITGKGREALRAEQ